MADTQSDFETMFDVTTPISQAISSAAGDHPSNQNDIIASLDEIHKRLAQLRSTIDEIEGDTTIDQNIQEMGEILNKTNQVVAKMDFDTQAHENDSI